MGQVTFITIADKPPEGWTWVGLEIDSEDARAAREGVTRTEMVGLRGAWLEQRAKGRIVFQADYVLGTAWFIFENPTSAMEFKLRWI